MKPPARLGQDASLLPTTGWKNGQRGAKNTPRSSQLHVRHRKRTGLAVARIRITGVAACSAPCRPDRPWRAQTWRSSLYRACLSWRRYASGCITRRYSGNPRDRERAFEYGRSIEQLSVFVFLHAVCVSMHPGAAGQAPTPVLRSHVPTCRTPRSGRRRSKCCRSSARLTMCPTAR